MVRHKARLVARGYVQQHGVDYWETYAPTVSATTLRTFLAVCMLKGMMVNQADVTTAFLYGDIDGEIYLKQTKILSKKIEEKKYIRKIKEKNLRCTTCVIESK